MIGLILAGGKGSRLRPFTWFKPKVLLPIHGTAIIDYQISWLMQYCDTVLVSINAHTQMAISEHLKQRYGRNKHVYTVYESTPLGTAGAIRKHLMFEAVDVLVVNGDTILDANIDKLIAKHNTSKAQLTIATTYVDQVGAGDIVINSEGKIIDFNYRRQRKGPSLISAGLYCISPKLIHELPHAGSFEHWTTKSLDKFRMISWLTTAGGLDRPAYYIDIGTPGRYIQAWIDAYNGIGPFAHRD